MCFSIFVFTVFEKGGTRKKIFEIFSSRNISEIFHRVPRPLAFNKKLLEFMNN